MNRVVHFDIMCDDPQRAILFYQKVFGWTIKKWEDNGMDYWLVMTGPQGEMGIGGGLSKRQNSVAGDGLATYLCTIGVENIDEMTKKIADNGGTIVKPKYEIPKVGWLAYCKDTEGNMFNVMQSTMPMSTSM